MHISETRNALVAYSFLLELRLKHGVRHVKINGASWYCLAANWARVIMVSFMVVFVVMLIALYALLRIGLEALIATSPLLVGL